jgi:transposase
MIFIGIDTHQEMHYVEMQNERQQVLWNRRIWKSREGFLDLMEKIEIIRRSISQEIMGIFMNPTGDYHVPLRYFLENNGYHVFLIDARRAVHLRKIMNLGTEKSERGMHTFWQPPPG